MKLVYLIKHATPLVQPGIPAEEWQLSATGVEEARLLAKASTGWALGAVYSSVEAKAIATASFMADRAGQQVRIVEGFEELRLGWIPNADDFSGTIRTILEHPDASLRRAESATAAAARFAGAMRIVRDGPFPAAVVTHGRVLTAYLASVLTIEDPFALWRAIPLAGWGCIDVEPSPPDLIEPFRAIS
jgi:broad specificity phosphatase PhoE